MKHPDRPSNEGRNNLDTSADNGNRCKNNNRKNDTYIADDIVKVLCMFESCPGLRTKHHDFAKSCVECCRRDHQLCVKKLENIEFDQAGPVCCNKTCGAGYHDMTVDITTASDKKQRDENRRQIRTWRRQQQEERRDTASSKTMKRRAQHSVASKLFCTKLFPRQSREETGLHELQYYISTCQSSPKQG